MTDFGIFAGGDPVDVYKWEKVRISNIRREVVATVDSVHVGVEKIWPTYQEEFHWYEWNTPGYDDSAPEGRYWPVTIPEWATSVDIAVRHTGGRGFDGARGVGNNDGGGGVTLNPGFAGLPVPDGLRNTRVRLGRPGSYGGGAFGENRLPVGSVLEGFLVGTAVGPRPGSSTGSSSPGRTSFGRVWPGGAGGARDQPGQVYGGAGGGGEGGPIFGNPAPKQGQNGAPGYVAIRFRSGPVPDGHTWPENPDWENPQ